MKPNPGFRIRGSIKKSCRNGLNIWIQDMYLQLSGQIIATSHDLTPNGGLVREIPLFQGNRVVGEILFHLARTIDSDIEGQPYLKLKNH